MDDVEILERIEEKMDDALLKGEDEIHKLEMAKEVIHEIIEEDI